MRFAVAVWTQRYGILNSVVTSICQRLAVVHFQKRTVVASTLEGRLFLTALTDSIRSCKHFSDHVRVAAKDGGGYCLDSRNWIGGCEPGLALNV